MVILSAAMSEILAENIRNLRKQMDVTQAEFGEQFGASQGTVARWEAGAEPKSEPLGKIADYIGCTVQDLTMRLVVKGDRQVPSPSLGFSGGAVYLPVQLPNEEALTEMFQQLFDSFGQENLRPELAERLARLLPAALAQTAAQASRVRPGKDLNGSGAEDVQPPATQNHKRTPRPRI